MPRNRRRINITHGHAFDTLRRQSSTFGAIYRNNDAQPIVSRVQVVKQESEFLVRAYFPDESTYIRGTIFLGQLRYFSFEGMPHGETEYSIKLETNNSRLFLFFIKELIRISPGVSESGVIDTLEDHGFSMDMAYPSAQDIPTWDVCLTTDPRPGKTFTFRNSSDQAKIRTIIVMLENQRHCLNIHVVCGSDDNFHALVSVLAANNLIEEEYYRASRQDLNFYVDLETPETIQKLRLLVSQLQSFEPLLDNNTFTRLCNAINMGSGSGERLIPIQKWTQIGDWNRILTSARGPMRHVEFSNPQTQSPIIAIFLSESRVGNIMIVLDIHVNQYPTFKRQLITQDLSSLVNFDGRLSQISLAAHFSDSPFLISFLMKAQQVEACIGLVFEQITGLINQTVNTNAIRPPIITETQDSSNSMNIDAPPASLRTNEYMVRIDNILRSERLRIIDGHTGSRRSSLIPNYGSRTNSTNRTEHANIFYRGARFGYLRSSTDRPLGVAQETPAALQTALNQSFAEHYGHTAATYRPSQSIAPAMLDSGANAKALDGLNVSLPEHLSCKLSLKIMTDPVRFEGIANKDCFEYAWIIEHLKKDKKHPITRQTVSEEMLVSDLPLKRECDEFAKTELETKQKLKIK